MSKLLIFSSLFCYLLFCQKNILESAKLAYDQGKYLVAIDFFETALKKKNIDKANIFYNLGNCYAKMSKKQREEIDKNKYLMKSIVSYEKSLLYKPTDEKSLENLKYVLNENNLLEGYQLPEKNSFLKVAGYYYYLPFNTQAIILFGCLFILIILFAVVIFTKKIKNFFLIFFIFYILLTVQFILRARVYKNNLYGLTKQETTTTYSEPNLVSKGEIILPSIEKLLLFKKEGNFFQINFKGKKLWVREKDMELIH